MSLSDAKRVLQWRIVTEALTEAGVDAETLAMVEHAQHVSTIVNVMAQTLVGTSDVKQAKNYIKVEMVGLIPPFERAYVELVRPGGKTSHELLEMMRDCLDHTREMLSHGAPTDGLRQGLIDLIDEALAKEAP